MSKTREQLEELQKKYFAALDEITKAKECLTDEIRQGMQADLYKRYRVEYLQLMEQAKIEDKNIDFDTALKIYMLTPHRRGFLWLFNNEAKLLKIREATAECDSTLQLRELAVEQLEETIAAADKADVEDVITQPEPTKDDIAAAREEYKRLKRLYKRSRHKNNAPAAEPTACSEHAPALDEQPAETNPEKGQSQEENSAAEQPKRKRRSSAAAVEAQSEHAGQLPGQMSLSDIQPK